VEALKVDEVEAALKEFVKIDAPTVLITREPWCAAARGAQALGTLHVLADRCNGCTFCFRIGCPAILKSTELDQKDPAAQGAD